MAQDSSFAPRSSRTKSRRFWPVLLLIACFFASAVAGAMFASNTLKKLPNLDTQLADVLEDEDQLLKVSDKTTVLIMGVDEREDDVGRSDTIIVATIDPVTNQAALLSIPRDTRVKIGNRGFDKINAAYAYGGVRLSERTVENFLGIDIDHYVTVNTHAFVDLVDAIGGVDLDVEKRMYYEDPWDDDGGLVIDLYPGYQHLDGADAVTYVRYRDSEGDIGRVKRQQKFIAAVVDKLASPAIIPTIPTLIRETVDAVTTDLSMRQILELAGSLNDAYQNGLEMDMVPGHPIYIDDVSYWIPDVEMVRLSVADTLGIEVDPFLRERMRDAASEYNSSIPDGAARADDDNPVGRPYSRKNSSSGTSNRHGVKVNDLGRSRDYEPLDRSEERDSTDRHDRTESTTYDDRSERTDSTYNNRSESTYDRTESTYDDRYDRTEPTYYDRSDQRYDQTEPTYEERYDRTEPTYDRYDRAEPAYDDRYDRTEPTYDDRYDRTEPNYEQPFDRGYDNFYSDDELQAPEPNEYRR